MNFDPGRPTKRQIVLIIIFIIEAIAAYGLWALYSESRVAENNTQIDTAPGKYAFKPSVRIGCDRVVWEDTEVHLTASTNLRKPVFQWSIENKTIGTGRNMVYTFSSGQNTVLLKAASGNESAQDEIEITVVNSTQDISTHAVPGGMGSERVFMTKFNDAEYYIDGVSIIQDGKDLGTIPECRKMTVSGLPAGAHTWKATYRGKEVGGGSFNLESFARIKITRIDIAGSYRAGDTVEGRIHLQNTGTVPVKEYALKTLVVNHKFEWMGDVSKQEFVSTFDYELKPGDAVEIPVRVQIPETINGIRPSGDYSITIQLMINNGVVETQTVKTVVV